MTGAHCTAELLGCALGGNQEASRQDEQDFHCGSWCASRRQVQESWRPKFSLQHVGHIWGMRWIRRESVFEISGRYPRADRQRKQINYLFCSASKYMSA